MRLLLERLIAPVSTLLLLTDEDGALRGLEFGDHESRVGSLMRRYYGDCTITEGSATTAVTRSLAKYFAGDVDAFAGVRIAMGGTPFQRQVWNGLRAIPFGVTKSYGELAADIGRPGASRAVGAANGANPLAIIVPCHRVIGADGTLTGFGGGLPRKQWLLDHERQFVPASAKDSELLFEAAK